VTRLSGLYMSAHCPPKKGRGGCQKCSVWRNRWKVVGCGTARRWLIRSPPERLHPPANRRVPVALDSKRLGPSLSRPSTVKLIHRNSKEVLSVFLSSPPCSTLVEAAVFRRVAPTRIGGSVALRSAVATRQVRRLLSRCIQKPYRNEDQRGGNKSGGTNSAF